MNWHFVEMHCHTCHSDGKFTPEDLVQAAKDNMLDGISLTDHNTMSGYKALRKTGFPFIPGIEWTTFFGHMLVLNAREYVDWRDAKPDNIDEKMRAVHAAGGLVGIAHPFDLGSPMCTGCYWDFHVQDWNNVDYIEVWHEAFPPIQWKVRQAKELWTSHLDQGFRIAPMYGRDWHANSFSPEPFAVTMLGGEGENYSAEQGYNAVKNGRVMLVLGPAVYFHMEKDGKRYELGDTVKPGTYRACVKVDRNARRAVWQRFEIEAKEAIFYGKNCRELARVALDGEEAECMIDVDTPFVRMEVQGCACGKDCAVAISAPIYVEA